MLSDIGPVPAGLFGAMAFGAGDFAGGRASLRINGLLAVAVAQLLAAITSLAVLALTGSTVPQGSQQTLAALAGVFHASAVFFIYQGMAWGRVSVVAPVSGIVGIAVPALADMLFIAELHAVTVAGIVLAAVSIVLLSGWADEAPDQGPTSFSIRYGFISGICYGLADLCLGLMTVSTAEGGLAVARLTGATLSIALLCPSWLAIGLKLRATSCLARLSYQVDRLSGSGQLGVMPSSPSAAAGLALPRIDARMKAGLCLAAGAGLLDCFGQLGYVLSATQGRMSTAAALVALYPAAAVGLAVWLLKERLSSAQSVGLGMSFMAIVLLSQAPQAIPSIPASRALPRWRSMPA